MRDLDPDEVSAIYEDLEMTYQIEWRRRGHRSMHLGYYDDEDQDPGEAAKNTVRLLSEAVGIDSGDRVLDVGCGAGEGAVWNARVNGATVLGSTSEGDSSNSLGRTPASTMSRSVCPLRSITSTSSRAFRTARWT